MKPDRELCKVCGTTLYGDPELRPDRLCPKHLAEARAATPPFVDGTRVTPGSGGCRCDSHGTVCEFPCWQRIGLTSEPCCPECAPLEEPEPQPVASVSPLRGADER